MRRSPILSFIFTILLLIPTMFFFTACGDEEHEHEFSTKWEYNATQHWHECLSGDCEERSGLADHEYTDDDDKDCNVCGYERTAVDVELTTFAKNKTYNGTPQGLIFGEDYYVDGGSISITYKEKDSTDEFSEDVPIYPGTYIAKVNVEGNALYKATSATAEYKINKVQIASLNKESTIVYNGLSTYTETNVPEKVSGEDIKVVVTFSGNEVGSTATNIELVGEDKDYYELVKDNMSYRIIAKYIRLGNGIKDRKFYVNNTLDGKFTTVMCDATTFGVLDGEEVYISISKTYDWASGTKIRVVSNSDDYVLGQNELATLSGANAGNYQLAEYANATYTELKTEFVGEVRNNSTCSFGTNTDSIKYGAKEFVVNQADNDYRSVLYAQENQNKNVAISIYTTSSTLIAKLTVTISNTGTEQELQYSGGNISDTNGTVVATFKLIKNVSGYTDSEGRWICKTPSITLEMVLEFTD